MRLGLGITDPVSARVHERESKRDNRYTDRSTRDFLSVVAGYGCFLLSRELLSSVLFSPGPCCGVATLKKDLAACTAVVPLLLRHIAPREIARWTDF